MAVRESVAVSDHEMVANIRERRLPGHVLGPDVFDGAVVRSCMVYHELRHDAHEDFSPKVRAPEPT
jgi:hypothetical protein